MTRQTWASQDPARPSAPVDALFAGLEAVLVVDAKTGRIEWASEHAAALFGSSAEALTGRSLADRFSESRDVETVLGTQETRVLDVHLAAEDETRGRAVEVEPPFAARADPGFARVVLDNLVGNAWKYTKGTPETRIEVGRTRDRAVYVRDNGPGFAPEHAESVFLAFERLESAKEFEGSGIGLATVRRIVHRHGGRVWAEGRPGKGASFYVRFEPEASE